MSLQPTINNLHAAAVAIQAAADRAESARAQAVIEMAAKCVSEAIILLNTVALIAPEPRPMRVSGGMCVAAGIEKVMAP